MKNVITGQSSAWNLQQKLGEGDAGEVFLVSSVRDGKLAILKRPRKSAFHADILRQASQIYSETRILQALRGFRVKLDFGSLTVPQLIDQARPESESTADYFMVIEKAPGIDLDFLARLQHFDEVLLEQRLQTYTAREQHFLKSLISQKKLPDWIILRCLNAAIVLFEEIHSYPVELDGIEKGGILWNDVKPEHIFWDPETRQCTLIDWGNAQFLEMDGTTRDRLFSSMTDYLQFLDGIGKFLKASVPDLYQELDWETHTISPETSAQEVRSLCQKIEKKLSSGKDTTLKFRAREQELLKLAIPRVGHIKDLDRVHQQLYAAGEYPDIEAVETISVELGKQLLEQEKLVEFRWLAEWTSELPVENRIRWQLLSTLSNIGLSIGEENRSVFFIALQYCLNGQEDEILWHLMKEMGAGSIPAWYQELGHLIRTIQLDLEPDSFSPLESVSRLAESLERNLKPSDNAANELDLLFEKPTNFLGMNEKNRKMVEWLKRLKSEIIPRWQQLEPDPPQAGLAYNDLIVLSRDIEAVFPDAAQYLQRAVYQPAAQAQIILDAWERKDFNFSFRALRRLMVWDPDRLRIVRAGSLIEEADAWLEQLSKGPQSSESLEHYAARHEIFARELRNRIGPAEWLLQLLAVFKLMRQGEKTGKIVLSYPGVVAELPWMKAYFLKKPSGNNQTSPTAAPVKSLSTTYWLERKEKNYYHEQLFKGEAEGKLGQGGDLVLGEPLDVWKPEAQGSSARVFNGFIRTGENGLVQRAVKIMRPDERDYALPLFEEEVRILNILQDFPGITPLLEFGFWLPENLGDGYDIFKMDQSSQNGQLLRFGWDAVDSYLEQMQERAQEGWLPYLVMEKKNEEENLLTLCDAGYTQGNVIPVKFGLQIAIQICDIMAYAHRHNILYRDHKILHYYWQAVYNGVFVIDWNVAKLYDRELTQSEKQFDLVQFGARALHHILTGKPAPGALPLGPTRPDEIENALNHYNVNWSFDDQRLSDDVKQIVEKTLAGKFNRSEALQLDLLEVFHQTTD